MCGIFLGLAIILSLIQPVTALVWGRYIDSANAHAEIVDLQRVQLVSLIGLAVLYWLIGFLGNLLDGYLYGGEDIQRLSKVQDHRLQEKFQAKMFRKISRLYPDYMEVPKINDMINRSFGSMGGEWSSLQRGVMIEGYVIIARVVSVVAVALSLYMFNPLLSFIVLAAPLPSLYTTYVGNKLNFKFSRDNGPILRKADYYQGVLLGASAKEVKALNLFDFFFGKWKPLADEYLVKERQNRMRVFIMGTVSGVISNIASVGANVFAIILLTRGELSIGALGAVLALIGTLMGSTSGLFGSLANFISKKNESAQFFELIDLNEQIINCEPGNLTVDTLSTQDVSFRYPLTDDYRIRNINFSLSKGEKVAFVGENGAGKTTFIKLLTGMLEPSKGEILINGLSAKEHDPATRYNAISCVFQEPSRFNTFTIADNVFIGDVLRERNEQRIDEALAFAAFEGADKAAILGKDIGGTELSGGQWQKIAIARAYYRGRDFFVLDEPTSNLDPIAEADVFKQYIAMTQGKTVIMVTHRISVASLADRVVVFKDGEIIEDGRHDELLAKNGEYARLYSTQAQWYDR
jgi:ATP-binding cassette subfamily B protein